MLYDMSTSYLYYKIKRRDVVSSLLTWTNAPDNAGDLLSGLRWPRRRVPHWRVVVGGTLISDKLSRNSRIRVLKLKARVGHRERDDGSALSSSPSFDLSFFPRSWDGRQTLGAGAQRRETKEGEKREKRKYETAGLPTTMGPYDPLCQWRSTADYRFDSLGTEDSNRDWIVT